MSHNEKFLNMVNQAKSQISELDIHQVKTKLDNQEDFYFVDTREDREWEKGRCDRAIHLGKGIIERDIENVIPDLNAEIVLYCGGGFRSALAAQSLQQMGYTNVISMDGGYRAWKEAGYPIDND